MKAHDERDGGGIFQDPQHVHGLEAARVGADGDRMGTFTAWARTRAATRCCG